MDKAPEYTLADSIYGDMASEIIQGKRPDILDAGVSVGFISSTKKKVVSKTKLILGECKKVPELYKLYCPYDFLIIIYEENCAGLTEEQRKVLIWHELLHIGIDDKGDLYLRGHDLEEFDEIIAAHGAHWQGERTEVS